MDLTLAALIALIIQNGVPGLLLVAMFFLVRHHLAVLKGHQETIDDLKKIHSDQIDKCAIENRELEKELRDKIEELLKDQLETQKPLTEALVEYNRLIRGLKKDERT